jgi:hypothetical protein
MQSMFATVPVLSPLVAELVAEYPEKYRMPEDTLHPTAATFASSAGNKPAASPRPPPRSLGRHPCDRW